MLQTIEKPAGAEPSRSLPEVFQSIVDHANARLVFGEPVSVGGKTILPVATIRYGFGGGLTAKDGSQQQSKGGGGLVAKPVGVIEVTESRTRFISIASNRMLLAALAFGVALGFLVAPKRVAVRVEKRRQD